MSGYDPTRLIFLDESAVNTNMTRIYARAKDGTRAIDSAPINTPTSTTILFSIRLNGSMKYTTYTGGTTATKFVEYLQDDLLSSLEKEDIVVMDNMRSHHAKDVKNFWMKEVLHACIFHHIVLL